VRACFVSLRHPTESGWDSGPARILGNPGKM
jgi:hypothetical protein